MNYKIFLHSEDSTFLKDISDYVVEPTGDLIVYQLNPDLTIVDHEVDITIINTVDNIFGQLINGAIIEVQQDGAFLTSYIIKRITNYDYDNQSITVTCNSALNRLRDHYIVRGDELDTRLNTIVDASLRKFQDNRKLNAGSHDFTNITIPCLIETMFGVAGYTIDTTWAKDTYVGVWSPNENGVTPGTTVVMRLKDIAIDNALLFALNQGNTIYFDNTKNISCFDFISVVVPYFGFRILQTSISTFYLKWAIDLAGNPSPYTESGNTLYRKIGIETSPLDMKEQYPKPDFNNYFNVHYKRYYDATDGQPYDSKSDNGCATKKHKWYNALFFLFRKAGILDPIGDVYSRPNFLGMISDPLINHPDTFECDLSLTFNSYYYTTPNGFSSNLYNTDIATCILNDYELLTITHNTLSAITYYRFALEISVNIADLTYTYKFLDVRHNL